MCPPPQVPGQPGRHRGTTGREPASVHDRRLDASRDGVGEMSDALRIARDFTTCSGAACSDLRRRGTSGWNGAIPATSPATSSQVASGGTNPRKRPPRKQSSPSAPDDIWEMPLSNTASGRHPAPHSPQRRCSWRPNDAASRTASADSPHSGLAHHRPVTGSWRTGWMASWGCHCRQSRPSSRVANQAPE